MKLKFRSNSQIHFRDFGKNPKMMLTALYVDLLAKRKFVGLDFEHYCEQIEDRRWKNGQA